ncbi:MAG: hypothetical protein ACHQ50_17760, partial [Fimbriimonadales bacterium]
PCLTGTVFKPRSLRPRRTRSGDLWFLPRRTTPIEHRLSPRLRGGYGCGAIGNGCRRLLVEP